MKSPECGLALGVSPRNTGRKRKAKQRECALESEELLRGGVVLVPRKKPEASSSVEPPFPGVETGQEIQLFTARGEPCKPSWY